MDLEKIIQVVDYILQKHDFSLNYTKLLKLLYIADRKCLDRWNFTISEDNYSAMEQGMVLSGLYDFIRGKADSLSQIKWDSYFYKHDYELRSRHRENCSYDELSKAEREILDEVDKKYHSESWQYLVDEVVHKFPEWKAVEDKIGNSSLKIEKEKILSVLGRDEQEIKEIISSPDVDGNVLAVNMTTLRNPEKADSSCVLDAGDRPEIKHKSFVFYRQAVEAAAEKIMIRILSQCYKDAEKLTDKILRKIQEGAKKSKFLPEKLKKYFEYF
ncbi:MAG: SocA family protein [Endomicrobium sp.]|jgi:uncharacterized phage-associated protein|nr:SocA family protein [Endomicrobium sp.]